MPGGDGTGPMGMGPMTGRAAGYCAGINMPGFANAVFGYSGLGRGFGRGIRHMYPANGMPGWRSYAGYWGLPEAVVSVNNDPDKMRLAAQREVSWLTNEIAAMEQALQNTKARLEVLTKNQE
jgi:hypothetical protein